MNCLINEIYQTDLPKINNYKPIIFFSNRFTIGDYLDISITPPNRTQTTVQRRTFRNQY